MKIKTNRALLLTLLPCATTTAFAQTDITDITGGETRAQHADSPATESSARLFDNTPSTKFFAPHKAAWVQYQAAKPFVVTKYALTSANDFPERDPKNWTLQGSNDGATWATINIQNNQAFTSRFQRREFSFANTVAYSRYLLNLTGAESIQLAEWELFSLLPAQDITNLPGELTAQHDYKSSYKAESLERVIDNQSETKYLTNNDQGWIQFRSGHPSTVTKYALTSANDAPTRDPQNWSFQGSNDGKTWTTLDSRANQDFQTRFLKREFSFPNSTPFTHYRLNMNNREGGILQLGEWEITGTGGGGTVAPVETWKEHWFDHNQLLTRVYYDDDVAVYFDPDVDRSVTWLNDYMGDVWRYTKKVYGDFGADKRLHVIAHTGKYGGGHPSTYFDASHDYRNVIDCGPGPWTTFDYNATAIPIHEVGHIVEIASKGKHNSPAFGLWGDSKWMEIYIYDVYKGLGQADFAAKWYGEQINRSDKFPREGTHWFRDWFYPIYNNYGESKVLNAYFTLVGQNFPTSENGTDYSRAMNWGEFVHFWSGAAGKNLKAQATTAFGWPAEYEAQFNQAKLDFPNVTYAD